MLTWQIYKKYQKSSIQTWKKIINQLFQVTILWNLKPSTISKSWYWWYKIFNKINERLTPDERCLIKVNSFKDLATILVERTTTEELKNLIEVLNDLLAPSADFSVIEEIQDFIINS